MTVSTTGAYSTREGGAFKEGFLYGAMHKLFRRISPKKKKKPGGGCVRKRVSGRENSITKIQRQS